MTHRYILSANGDKAMAIHSSLLHHELADLIRRQSQWLHPDSTDRVWRNGTVEFVNPQLMGVEDFANHCPALIALD